MSFSFQHAIDAFFKWWFAELRGCLPRSVDAVLFGSDELVRARFRHNAVDLRLTGGSKPRDLGAAPYDPNAPTGGKRAIRRVLRRRGVADRPIVLELDAAKIIEVRLDAPIAAADNLADAIELEMDRHTPFAATDVVYDHQVLGVDHELERIALRVKVARRADVDDALRRARSVGLRPSAVTVPEEGPSQDAGAVDAAFNLLPASERPAEASFFRYAAAALSGLAVMAAAAAFATWVERQERMLAASEAQLRRLSAEAARVADLDRRVDALSHAADYVTDRKLERTPVVARIAALTDALPDAHWLEILAISGDELRLTGYSRDPSDVLRRLEESPLFSEVRFVAPVTRDPKTGADRLSLVATMNPDAAPTASAPR